MTGTVSGPSSYPRERQGLAARDILPLAACVLAALAMFVRMFYGTELTDEAYYVSDALSAMHGNFYYAYNNAVGTGCGLLMIPFLFVYELLVPSGEGVFLYSRICYMIFWCAVMLAGCRILMKDFGRPHALLVTAFMIAFAGGIGIYNFSYNTVPCALSYISGLVIYDALEHGGRHVRLRLALVGFLMGIALVGHIGSGIIIASFAVVIIARSRDVRTGAVNLACCLAGGILQLLVVTVPVIVQAGLPTFMAGLDNLAHPYPEQNLTQDTVWDRLSVILRLYCIIVPFAIAAFAAVYFLSKKFLHEGGLNGGREGWKPLSKRACALLAAFAAIALPAAYCCFLQLWQNSPRAGMDWGFLAGMAVPLLLCMKEHKKYPVILYLGLYPLAFAFGEMIMTESNASLARLPHAAPAFAVYLLVMLGEEGNLLRRLVVPFVICCTVTTVVSNYRFCFHDGNLSQLDSRVESGVYKGVFTTAARAHDLPETEEYLNKLIAGGETYAFRDNVPGGYLMARRGVMCDRATWDRMQYSYGVNAPDNLYAYYQRKGKIPQKYIYVDFGIDELLSIEKDGYLFNEFVNSYYKKTADFAMNETFRRVIVYEYAGGFDGDFGYWIDRHMLRD